MGLVKRKHSQDSQSELPFWELQSENVGNRPCLNIKIFISLETLKVQTLKVRSKFILS
jgi:hypothetical protein